MPCTSPTKTIRRFGSPETRGWRQTPVSKQRRQTVELTESEIFLVELADVYVACKVWHFWRGGRVASADEHSGLDTAGDILPGRLPALATSSTLTEGAARA